MFCGSGWLVTYLARAVRDRATVPMYYESGLIPLDLSARVDPDLIDERADEATAGLDDSERERIHQAVVVMNALYGAPDRLEKLSADIVAHWTARSAEMKKFIGVPGKGMIVCATREICVVLYEQIIAIKRDWHSDDDRQGKIKVVYSGGPLQTRRPRSWFAPPAPAQTTDDIHLNLTTALNRGLIRSEFGIAMIKELVALTSLVAMRTGKFRDWPRTRQTML
jgi:hypothetical protein